MVRYLLMALFVVVCGCSHPAEKTGRVTNEHYVSDPNSVPFDIQPVAATNGSSQWLASYSSRGKIAKFRIELGPAAVEDTKGSKDFPISFGQGRFLAEPGSDATVMLADLKKALEAKKSPSAVQRVASLSFTFANIGDHLSQAPSNGGFNAEPPGNWTALKIFLGEGDQEGQVFLNLNSVMDKGQFSLKDPDYGDIVLWHLSRVL